MSLQGEQINSVVDPQYRISLSHKNEQTSTQHG
jgi:hypothetical protein